MMADRQELKALLYRRTESQIPILRRFYTIRHSHRGLRRSVPEGRYIEARFVDKLGKEKMNRPPETLC